VKFEEPFISLMEVVPVSSVMSVSALKLLALDPYFSLGTTFGLPGHPVDVLDLNLSETHLPLAGVNGPLLAAQ
jgi:hypothetical protein